MRRLQAVSFLIAVALLLALAAGAVQAQEKTLYWESYDVDITILTNGDFRVIETQHLVFTSGVFRFGVRTIPLEYVANISDVQVSEADGAAYRRSSSDEPFTYRTYQSGGDFNVRYNFPPTADDDRTMVLQYTVSGGLLYYAGGDQLVWRAVPANATIPIQRASVTVHLPEGASLDNYDATGPQGAATVIDNGQAVRFETTEAMRGGPDFAVRVQWPSGIVAGEPTAWQEEIDFQDRWRPIADLGTLGLSIFLLVAGPLGLYLLWYKKGRDAPVKLPAEWIPEPPSDLPAGLVGALVDEQADMKDIIATLIDLARRGVLAIQEIKSKGILGIGEKRDFIYRLEDDSLPLRSYEKLLVDKLFGSAKEKKLSELKEKFYQHVPKLKQAMYEDVVAEAFFPASPERTRSIYGVLGVVALVAVFIVGVFIVGLLASLSSFALCIPLALGVPALGLIILARFMPRKTAKGAEEAAKWMAFKRYMQNIEQYTDVAEAKEIFDKYLPYAIAFGLEDSWIHTFAQVDTAPPPWYYPGPYVGPRPRRYWWWGPGPAMAGGGGVPGHAAPAPEGGGFSPPSLGDASKGLGQSLAGMSAGLGAMLSSASSTLTSRPAPQQGSGSWSRGGGSWSGGGGFSGGGWSGGGGFGGGGGGGSSFG